MAHFQVDCHKISRGFRIESPAISKGTNQYKRIGFNQSRTSCKNLVGYRHRVNLSVYAGKNLERENGPIAECSSSSSSSASTGQEVEFIGECGEREGQNGYVVRDHGWQVRRMAVRQDEMRKVAQVQAEAFHVPVLLFNDWFFQFFQVEVLAGLFYRLENSPPDRYACLVAEPLDNAAKSRQQLVGVVDATVLRDKDVIQHLPGADEYLYVSGIAVSTNFRRQKVATALLKACDVLSVLWGYEYLVLRAYEQDWGARRLYMNAGYRVVSADPPWITTWIGRKRRVLMIKRSNLRE